jgi:hypothetical protein
MKKPISLPLTLLGSLVLLIACTWPARSQAQGVPGSPTNAAAAAAAGVIPKAAMLKPGWRPLLDEKLTAWELWMGVPRQTVVGLPEGTPTSASGRDGTPLGLSNDPKHVYSIRMEDGEPVLHITGEIMGGLTTLETFSNYHLRVQVKWEPKPGSHPVTGILYDCTGPHGVFWKAWKRCFKFQVTGKDMGDLYALGGTCAEVHVVHPDRLWLFDPAGETKKIAEAKLPGSTGNNRGVHLPGDFDKPAGEWNTLELYVLGRSAVHVVNGHVALAIQNASTIEGPELTETPLSGGQLQIQSEGGEVIYRRVEIEPITELPAAIKQAAGL